MGNCCKKPQADQDKLVDEGRNTAHLASNEDLPPGWHAVPSRSRPGRIAYQNVHTGERISWVPKEPAATFKGAIKKKRKVKANGSDTDTKSSSFQSQSSEKTMLMQSSNTITSLSPV